MFITAFVYYSCIGHVNVNLILMLSPLIINEYLGKQIYSVCSLYVLLRYVMLVSLLLITT
jgi:hypothetical protein